MSFSVHVFHQAMQSNAQFKTHELILSRIFHLIFSDHETMESETMESKTEKQNHGGGGILYVVEF